MHTPLHALPRELTRRRRFAVPPPGFRPGMPPPGFVPGSAHPLVRGNASLDGCADAPSPCAQCRRLATTLGCPRLARFRRREAFLRRATRRARRASKARTAREQSTAQRLDFWCIDVVTHSCSQRPSEGSCVCVRLQPAPDTTHSTRLSDRDRRGCLGHSRAPQSAPGRAVACMGWTRGRALAWALQLAVGAVVLRAAQGEEWQVAAVRVNAGPLNPAQAAVRAVNATFVRAEQKRFWLGCRQLSIVGFNSYTLIEQAAEERL